MKKLLLVMMGLMSVIVYAQQLKTIELISLVSDGIIFNNEYKLTFGANEADIVRILGNYMDKSPAANSYLLVYEDIDISISLPEDKRITPLEVIWFRDIAENVPFYIDGKEIYFGQPMAEIFTIFIDYEVVRIYDLSQKYRITYKIGDNYLGIDADAKDGKIIAINYSNEKWWVF